MISQTIKRISDSLTTRGLAEDSHFTVHFTDGSFVCEKDCNWSDISEDITCKFGNGTKLVKTCIHPVQKITIKHGTLETKIDVPDGCKVYQAIRAEAFFTGTGETKNTTIGRVVGIVRDDIVIEERFLNGLEGEIIGIRI